MLTWSANTFEIIALASRAFAFYYMLQCLVAMSVSRSTGQRAGNGGRGSGARLHRRLRGARELIARCGRGLTKRRQC